jgi:hypothetical protein
MSGGPESRYDIEDAIEESVNPEEQYQREQRDTRNEEG